MKGSCHVERLDKALLLELRQILRLQPIKLRQAVLELGGPFGQAFPWQVIVSVVGGLWNSE